MINRSSNTTISKSRRPKTRNIGVRKRKEKSQLKKKTRPATCNIGALRIRRSKEQTKIPHPIIDRDMKLLPGTATRISKIRFSSIRKTKSLPNTGRKRKKKTSRKPSIIEFKLKKKNFHQNYNKLKRRMNNNNELQSSTIKKRKKRKNSSKSKPFKKKKKSVLQKNNSFHFLSPLAKKKQLYSQKMLHIPKTPKLLEYNTESGELEVIPNIFEKIEEKKKFREFRKKLREEEKLKKKLGIFIPPTSKKIERMKYKKNMYQKKVVTVLSSELKMGSEYEEIQNKSLVFEEESTDEKEEVSPFFYGVIVDEEDKYFSRRIGVIKSEGNVDDFFFKDGENENFLRNS